MLLQYATSIELTVLHVAIIKCRKIVGGVNMERCRSFANSFDSKDYFVDPQFI